jgi:hypothetical protein
MKDCPIGSRTVNNTTDWRLQCGGFGGGGVDLRMGSGHGGGETGKEMIGKRSLAIVGEKMIGISHSRRERGIFPHSEDD